VYAAALAATVLAGGRQADEWVETDGGHERREATAQVAGTGTPATAVPAIDSVALLHR
jgi:hypothetical protein